MNLFIDTISIPWIIILFNDNRQIVDKEIIEIKGNESSLLIPKIDILLNKNALNYFDLKNIVVVSWPGSFTGVRTTVLVVNTINYIIKWKITSLNFFDLFDNYPIIKSSSKRDVFYKKDLKSKIDIIYNDELISLLDKEKITTIYWEVNKSIFEKFEIINYVNYEKIIKELTFDNNDIISPLYIKKPNIS